MRKVLEKRLIEATELKKFMLSQTTSTPINWRQTLHAISVIIKTGFVQIPRKEIP